MFINRRKTILISSTIFPAGRATIHYNLFLRSIQAMSKTLQQDMYKLSLPGILINSVKAPNPDPIASLRYSCVYWESHFQDACKGSSSYQRDLADNRDIHQFLENYFLHWLEALSLIGEIAAGVLAISSLQARLSVCVLYCSRQFS